MTEECAATNPLLLSLVRSDFADMMASFEVKGGKPSRYDWQEVPKSDSGKARFKDWDWISPFTLKKELGIHQEMALLKNLG